MRKASLARLVPAGLLFVPMFASLALSASSASAQVIYEPVQYQYTYSYTGGRDVTFYYGGDDPRVFDHAARIGCLRQGRTGVREGVPGVGLIHRGLIGEPPFLVFSDCAPYQNVAVYGFTPADARDEAYARVPRYFTKAGLLAAAVPADAPEYYRKETAPNGAPVDGSRVAVVPAHGWPAPAPAAAGIDIRPSRRPATGPATAPATRPAVAPAVAPAEPAEPKPLLVIPKRMLEQPKAADKSVAAAR